MRERKKGALQNSVIVAIIAAIVLAVVLIGVTPLLFGKTQFFDFKFGTEEQTTIENTLLRYTYKAGVHGLEYYTGTEFRSFEGKDKKIGEEVVIYSDTRERFRRYWVDTPRTGFTFEGTDAHYIIGMEFISVRILASSGGETETYKLRIDGRLTLDDKDVTPTAEQQKLIQAIILWRDSVTVNSLELSIEGENRYYCVKPSQGGLTVDLAKSVNEELTC